MQFVKLNATTRKATGKGASRRLRATGRTPGIVYGKDTPVTNISLIPEELQKALSGPLHINTPLDVTIGNAETGKTEDILVIVKDHQYDPVTRRLVHVDFLRITDDQQVSVDIPVERHGRAAGEVQGGVVRLIHRVLPILCKAKDIPEAIHVDVTALENGMSLHVSELTLPEGIVVDLPANEVVVTVSLVAEEEKAATPEATATAAAAAPAAGATPAPAAGAPAKAAPAKPAPAKK